MKRIVLIGVAIAVVAAVAGAAAYLLLASSPPAPVDTDGDGVPDSRDAFPNDPLEWADSDHDGVGDNADLYDAGNAALRVNVTLLVRLDDSPCGGGTCDIIFNIRIDPDGTEPFDPTCAISSPVYANVTASLENPAGATAACDVPERGTAALVDITVMDDGGTELDYTGGPGTHSVATVQFPPSGYFSSSAAFPYSGPPVQLDWRAEIVGL